jgi:hypothetical protein
MKQGKISLMFLHNKGKIDEESEIKSWFQQ